MSAHDQAGSFRRLTIDEFVEKLESSEPVPGGGSASAIAASLGASLVTMVANLSTGRSRYADHAGTHDRAAEIGRRLADRFLEIADADSDAYGSFAAAMRMPRDTDEERAARSASLRRSALTATEVPLSCVEACRDLVVAAELLAGRSNLNAASDLVVATHLAEAAARGAAANVRINLPALGDPDRATAISSRVDALLTEILDLAERTRAIVATGDLRDPIDADVVTTARR